MHDIGEILSAWNSFYAMIGSSAAALTGLMFVVITLVSDGSRSASEDGISTFSTPTVFHFCCVLLTAAFMSAPFHSLTPTTILLILTGTVGVFYVVRTALRTLRLKTYIPDTEDWIWHFFLPLAAYAILVVGAAALHADPSRALFAPATAVALLIFIGIHNAWDVVTFLATGKDEALPDRSPEADAPRTLDPRETR